jgi:membrane protein required for colicin V production
MTSAAWWAESATAGVAAAALRGLKPMVPERFGRHLPD